MTEKRDWNDPDVLGILYRTDNAPHEPAAARRMHLAGHSGPRIMEILKTRATKLMAQLQQSMDLENDAHSRGLGIHDGVIEKGTR